jgi:hypothetical protein
MIITLSGLYCKSSQSNYYKKIFICNEINKKSNQIIYYYYYYYFIKIQTELFITLLINYLLPDDSTLPPMKSAVNARLVTIIMELPKPEKQNFNLKIGSTIIYCHLLFLLKATNNSEEKKISENARSFFCFSIFLYFYLCLSLCLSFSLSQFLSLS